jgi:hypothetical protein
MYKVHFIKGIRSKMSQWLITRSDAAWEKVKHHFKGKYNMENIYVEETNGTVPSGDSF